MSYGYFKQFPISAYGDTYFLYIQSIIILLLVLYYNKNYWAVLISVPAIALSTILLFSNLLDADFILTLNGLNLFLSAASKLNQAFLNFRNSSTGNLSAITLILQFLGTVARIFTSIQETGDRQLIISFIVVSICNGLLVLQLVFYWNSATTPKPKKE